MVKKLPYVLYAALAVLVLMLYWLGYKAPEQRILPGDFPQISEANPWGLTLSVQEATPAGVNLTVTQSGGTPMGTLMACPEYWLAYRSENGSWQPLSYDPDSQQEDWVWIGQPQEIPLDGVTIFPIHWGRRYRTLEPGTYQIIRNFRDVRTSSPGSYDELALAAEFTIQ